MIRNGKDELMCDLAETYHIFNYRTLPARTVASLCVGLRDNSRIVMKLRGEKYPRELVVGAMIADRMALLYAWVTGAKEKPQLLTEMLFPNENEGNKEKADVFESFEAFRAEYDRLTRKDE